MNKTTRTVLGLALVGVGVLTLSACGKTNPLKTQSPESTAKFVMKASEDAEKKMGFKNVRGGQYGQCMEGRNVVSAGFAMPIPIDCKDLYKNMVDFAQKDPDFKGLSVQALTDKSVFSSFKEHYERDVFNNI